MWCIVQVNDVGGKYKILTKNGYRTYSRADGFLNELKRYTTIFTYRQPVQVIYDLIVKFSKGEDFEGRRIQAIDEIFPIDAEVNDFIEGLKILEDECGINVEKTSLGGFAHQFLKSISDDVKTLKKGYREMAEGAFHSGRVENLVKVYNAQRPGSIVAYDINGAYPYLLVMADVPATWGKEVLEAENLSIGDLRRLYGEGWTGVAYIKAVEYRYIPVLPYRNIQTFYPNGLKEGWYHLPEIFLLDDDDVLEVSKVLLFRKEKFPGRDHILRLFYFREKYRDRKFSKMFKYIANSVWGVISMRNIGNRIVGGYITSLQRARLYNVIRKLDEMGYKVLYYDTDSVIVDTYGEKEKVDKIIGVEGKVWGGWDVRYEGVNRIEAGGVKQYKLIFEDGSEKLVWKGIPLVADIKYSDPVSGLIVYDEYIYNEGNREVELKVLSIPKRNFLSDDFSIPFDVNEIEDLLISIKEENSNGRKEGFNELQVRE